MICVESVRQSTRLFSFEPERGRIRTFFAAVGCCAMLLSASIALEAQGTPQRDTQALNFLTQVLTAAGGSTAISAITDFTATGSVTYSWTNTSVQGNATIKSRGLTQFRLDSQVPDGTWSMVINNGVGVLNLPDGTGSTIAYHNTLNAGSLTLPITLVSAAVQDTSFTVIDDGVVPLGNGQAHQITIQQNLPSTTDPAGQFSKDAKRDYFFDPSSFQLLQVQDTVHPSNDAVNGGVQRIIGLSDYRSSNGILVPFSISQSVDGQTTWSIGLTSITFNTGLTDSDFQF
jgi:hypothetical protein